MTASAHDSLAFTGTCASKYPEFLFDGNEFAWADSAYSCTVRMIPIHKRPAAHHPDNAHFDKCVSHLRVRSEHCIGSLKGRWQCLRGLRVHINSKHEHVTACRWISICIILHNMLVEWEGDKWSDFWRLKYHMEEEFDPAAGGPQVLPSVMINDGEARRKELVDELVRLAN